MDSNRYSASLWSRGSFLYYGSSGSIRFTLLGGSRLCSRCSPCSSPRSRFRRPDLPDSAVSAAERLEIPADKPVLILRANHVVDSRSLGTLLRAGAGKEAAIMCGQGNRIGDGAYVALPSRLATVLRTLWTSADGELQLPEALTQVPSIDGLPCSLEGTAQSALTAESRLVGALSAHTRADDGFMARHFDRRLSQIMSRRLAHTNITPNQITLVGMSIGLIAAFLLSLRGYWAHLSGALLFVFCIIVDGVDGEIARLNSRTALSVITSIS